MMSTKISQAKVIKGNGMEGQQNKAMVEPLKEVET